MIQTVTVQNFAAPPIREREIYRYAGVRGNAVSGELRTLVEESIAEAFQKADFRYRVCYREFEVHDTGDGLDLGFLQTDSHNLRANLKNCQGVLAFAATIGVGLDRLIARYKSVSPAKALVFQAIGAERIEALCDLFNAEYRLQKEADGLYTRPRFSPGYGDFPLSAQRNFFDVLDCPRKIGVSLGANLLMTPSKSVTALIGFSEKSGCAPSGCQSCRKTDCAFRSV